MYLLLYLIFAVAGWIGGIMLSSKLMVYLQARHKGEKEGFGACAIWLLVCVGICVIATVIRTTNLYFALAGIAIGALITIDPFSLTEKQAQEIGKQAEAEKAVKDQKEEQKRQDQMTMKENARIYREEKAKLKSK